MDTFTIFAAVMYSLVIIAAGVAVLTVDKWPLPKWLRPRLAQTANPPGNDSKHRTAEADEDGSGDGDVRGTNQS